MSTRSSAFMKPGGRGDFDLPLLERLGDTNALIRHLRAHERPDYFATLAKQYPDALGDWINPTWIKLEKTKKIYPLYEDGAGNCIFFCETDRTIWDYDHEVGVPNGFIKIDSYQKRYTLKEPYQCFREYLLERYRPGYTSPHAVKVSKASSSVPAKTTVDRLKNAALTGAGLGFVGGGVGSLAGPAGAVAGAATGAYFGYTQEDASISGIAPVAPPQGAVQAKPFPQTGVVGRRKKVKEDAEFEVGSLLDL